MRTGLHRLPKPYGPLFLYREWDPYAPDDSPHPASCEFTDASDARKFTQVAMSANVTWDIATTMAKGLMMDPSFANWTWHSLLRPLPGDAEFSIFAPLHTVASCRTVGSVIIAGGLLLSDTAVDATGQQTAATIGSSSTHQNRMIESWNGFGIGTAGAAATDEGIGPARHVAVRKLAGTYYFGWSQDGEVYDWRSQALNGGVTPAYFGLYTQNYVTGHTGGAQFGFPHVRYYPTGTKKKSGRVVSIYR